MNYNKLLLDELRFVTYEKRNSELTDDLLVKAVTLNENLQSLGYILAPSDIASIAVSPSLDSFYEKVKGMMDTVDVDPMYPGFPQQVMELDEAVFRFHQLVHYFSTYGMELFFGVTVKKGWLPCEDETTARAKAQDIVLKAKTIKLLPVDESYNKPLHIILSRKERMTQPEREIVTKAISHVSVAELRDLTSPSSPHQRIELFTYLYSKHSADILQESFVLTIKETAFLSSGHQSFICIPDQLIGQHLILTGSDTGGLIAYCFFGRICNHLTVLISQVLTDDDPTVVEFKPLCGMNAPNLIKGIRSNREERIGEIPFCSEPIFEDDIILITLRIIFSYPFITVPSNHSGLVVQVVLLP